MASLLEYLAAILAIVLMVALGAFSINYSNEIIRGVLEFFNYLGQIQSWRPIIL